MPAASATGVNILLSSLRRQSPAGGASYFVLAFRCEWVYSVVAFGIGASRLASRYRVSPPAAQSLFSFLSFGFRFSILDCLDCFDCAGRANSARWLSAQPLCIVHTHPWGKAPDDGSGPFAFQRPIPNRCNSCNSSFLPRRYSLSVHRQSAKAGHVAMRKIHRLHLLRVHGPARCLFISPNHDCGALSEASHAHGSGNPSPSTAIARRVSNARLRSSSTDCPASVVS